MMSSKLYLYIIIGVVYSFSYNEDLAHEVIGYGFASYCSVESIQQWKVGDVSDQYPFMSDIKVIDKSKEGLRAFVSYSSHLEAIIISFRGSSNIQNWVTNLDVKTTSYRGTCDCQVHEGFYIDYLLIKNDVIVALAGLMNKYPNRPIYITGHSLGGAIATLLTGDLPDLNIQPSLLVTAGSPRVGDADYWKWFESRITQKTDHYRLVHEKDPVPHLPFHSWGFEHTTREVWYHKGTYTICKADFGEDKSCSNKIPIIFCNSDDHIHYVNWNQDNLHCV